MADIKIEMDNLTKQVEATESGEASAVLAFTRLAELIKANANDPVAVKALADRLAASAAALGAAVDASPTA